MISDPPIVAHSVAEAYLYLMIARCPACDAGPLRHTRDLTKASDGTYTLSAACSACRKPGELRFAISPPPVRGDENSKIINPTDVPSRCIDALGWYTLVASITSAAEAQTNKEDARELLCEAARCMDEAIKFYESGEEYPPGSAFFSADSRRRLHDHPQQFTRSKWQERRSKLPSERVLARNQTASSHWWQFWK